MESRDFVETFVRGSAERPGELRHYVQDFTNISARAIAAGNLSDSERGWWFMRGLPIEYCRYAIEKTGAVANEPSTFVFEKLGQAILSRIMVAEDAERMAILSEEDTQNI
jgi:hypothetical protein